MPSIQMQNRFEKTPLMSTLYSVKEYAHAKAKADLAKNYFILSFQRWKTQLCHMSHSRTAFTDGEKNQSSLTELVCLEHANFTLQNN
jgi:hypothetical protein